MSQMWSWVISAVSLAAAWMIGNGRRSGWLLNLLLQGVWIAYAVKTRQWGFLASCVPFGVVYARNWLKHGRD